MDENNLLNGIPNSSLQEHDKPSPKQLLIFSIPLSLFFAISGMDFIGFFKYLLTIDQSSAIYTRSLTNVLLGFGGTTISLFVIPFIFIRYVWKRPLKDFGSQRGNFKWGIRIVLLFLLVTPVFYFSASSQDLINTYPLTKAPLTSWGVFILYEIAYVLLYYIPYEFFFRGVLQLGLSRKWKSWQSILFVTALTTLLHLTKPLSEILAAAFAGILFGIIAEKTKSWYYVFLLHITVGILTDTFCSFYYLGIFS